MKEAEVKQRDIHYSKIEAKAARCRRLIRRKQDHQEMIFVSRQDRAWA